jgi:ubiquinone/menaquinone biosynthesis C-methylase UbiE
LPSFNVKLFSNQHCKNAQQSTPNFRFEQFMKLPSEIEIQRQYYAQTAAKYEEAHVHAGGEHVFALGFLMSSLDYFGIRSVLDIGCGTGRAIRHIKLHRPDIKVMGVEPVKELREVGYSLGLSAIELVEGDATQLRFADGEFDIVTEFGVLHHIPKPERAVAEMLRVGKIGVFISDSNNFGQGAWLTRAIKQSANALGLWRALDLIKTKGKGYSISEGDGLAYSYSVFNNYTQIQAACRQIHLLNTHPGGVNPYRTAGHVALLGLKK